MINDNSQIGGGVNLALTLLILLEGNTLQAI